MNIQITMVRLLIFSCIFFISQKKVFANEFLGDTISKNGKFRIMHIGWEDHRTPEFGNAYTLQRHEIRLNIIGRSSFAFNNKLEFSTYLPLFFVAPNFSLKYKLIDKRFFASAIEGGACAGVFPIAIATGLLLQGGALGVGSIGVLYGTDYYAKLYLSFPLSRKLTFSVRSSASVIHLGYWGIAAGAVIGRNGVGGLVLPIDFGAKLKWYAGATEFNYVLNKKNCLVLSTALGGFEGGAKRLGLAALSWTHAKAHFHYSLGLYSIFDPPVYDITKHSGVPISIFGNIYWIFNNGKRLR
ncbi:MAG: hypothetical protein LC115_04475 [Bacteroidia bacterium]|nr:hypothetical protein [Bacteroidia bacterium]